MSRTIALDNMVDFLAAMDRYSHMYRGQKWMVRYYRSDNTWSFWIADPGINNGLFLEISEEAWDSDACGKLGPVSWAAHCNNIAETQDFFPLVEEMELSAREMIGRPKLPPGWVWQWVDREGNTYDLGNRPPFGGDLCPFAESGPCEGSGAGDAFGAWRQHGVAALRKESLEAITIEVPGTSSSLPDLQAPPVTPNFPERDIE